jgi:hypothetical protein
MQSQHRASVQDHSGNVVCRQAAETLTLCFSQWRTEAALGEVAERHIRLTVKFLSTYTVLEKTEGSRRFATGQFLDVYFLQMKFEENTEIKNLFFTKCLTSVLSWIHCIKSLSNVEARGMCKLWPLLHEIEYHTPRYGVHTSICHSLLSDEMTSSCYLITSS